MLLHHLVGYLERCVDGDQIELTEYGSRLSNIVLRGTLNINLGGRYAANQHRPAATEGSYARGDRKIPLRRPFRPGNGTTDRTVPARAGGAEDS